MVSRASVALPYEPARDKFRVSIQSNPSPDIAPTLPFLFKGRVLFLCPDKRPDFVALESLTRKIAKRFVLIFRTSAAKITQKFVNRITRCASHARNGTHRISFNQRTNNPLSLLSAQLVHAGIMLERSSSVNGFYELFSTIRSTNGRFCNELFQGAIAAHRDENHQHDLQVVQKEWERRPAPSPCKWPHREQGGNPLYAARRRTCCRTVGDKEILEGVQEAGTIRTTGWNPSRYFLPQRKLNDTTPSRCMLSAGRPDFETITCWSRRSLLRKASIDTNQRLRFLIWRRPTHFTSRRIKRFSTGIRERGCNAHSAFSRGTATSWKHRQKTFPIGCLCSQKEQ